MRIWNNLIEFQNKSRDLNHPRSLTIGNFDGIHLGHQKLIQEVVNDSKLQRGSPLVITFHPHPQAFLNPEKSHSRIYSLQDQEQQLEKMGIQGLFRQAFSREFSQISPQEFVENFIVKNFQPSFVCVGEDFRFGAFRAGSGALLKELGSQFGFEVKLLPPVKYENEIVSTSQIKKYLLNGDVERARQFLGRHYSFQGLVEAGEGRGRQLGFPTANVRPDADFLPHQGVYVCRVWMKSQTQPHRAVVNIGINKTFVSGDQSPVKFEVHIFDWNKDLYGQRIKVELLHFLRPERKFSGKEELKQQIDLDIQMARNFVEDDQSGVF